MLRRALKSRLLPLLPLAVAAALGVAAAVRAQPVADLAILDVPLSLSRGEREALDLLEDDKLLTARTRAEEVLREEPGSFVGHYVLGSALRDAEGSLARAMSHLREARTRLEARFGAPPAEGEARRLHRDVLMGLEYTAGLMEQYTYELQILDEHDALYDPDLVGQHAWPLMKLGRFREARLVARRAIDSGSAWQKNLGLNALCAVEAEAHERRASYEQCKAALDHGKERVAQALARGDKAVPHLAVHAHNAALGALSVLRHDEAERLALDGTQRLESTASNPWRLLLDLYLTEGRAGDAVAAIRQMRRWDARRPAGSRDQKEAETAAETALLLLAAGEPEAGLHFISRALERPDRQGISSGQPEQAVGGHALLRRALLRLDAEIADERASARGFGGALSAQGLKERGAGILAALSARAAALPDEERVVNVLSDEERLVSTLRVYLDGGLDEVPTWLVGDLVPVVGPGVMAVALAEARRAETMPEIGPYFDAFEAEVALARGDAARAGALAAGAVDRLPRAEALLRARASAVAADAARRRGDAEAAAQLFQRALELDPGTLRRLGLAIPAVVRQDVGGEVAARAAEALRRSPRLYAAEGAFEVHVQQGSGPSSLRACLLAPFGASLGCGEITLQPGEPEEAAAARLADELHRTAFSLHLPITDTDLRSLDGSTTISRDAGRERLRGILEGGPDDQGAD